MFKNLIYRIGILLILIIGFSIGAHANNHTEYYANTQEELDSIINKINSGEISNTNILIKVNSYVKETVDRELKDNAYDQIFSAENMQEWNIPYIIIEGVKKENPFVVKKLEINSDLFPIIKVKNLTFSSNNYKSKDPLQLKLNNSNGFIIFFNNDIKNATGTVNLESDSINFFNNNIDSNSINFFFNYKDNLILNENTFISNTATNNLLNIKNKYNVNNVSAIAGNKFLYNSGNLISAESDKILSAGNIYEENTEFKNIFNINNNISANTLIALEDGLNITSDGVVYRYNANAKGASNIDLSEDDISQIEKALLESLNNGYTVNTVQKSVNQLLGGEDGGLLGGLLGGAGNLVSGILTALNPLTYVRAIINTITNVVSTVVSTTRNIISSTVQAATNLIRNTVTLATNIIRAAIQIIMVPVENIIQAVGFITNYNDYLSSIPTYDVGVSINTRTLNSVKENIISKATNNTNSSSNKNISYHFQDTRVGNYSTDWLVTFNITNTSDYDIIFNNMLITEYIGEGITQPVGSNQNQRMFEQGNRDLAILLNQMYNNPDMREYLNSVPNMTDFIQDNLPGLNITITQPQPQPGIQEILSGIMEGVTIGSTFEEIEVEEIENEKSEEQPLIQMNRLMSVNDNNQNYFEKYPNQEIDPGELEELEGFQYSGTVFLPQESVSFISVDNLIYTGDSDNNGNFLVSAVNCQAPYYSPLTNGEERGSILDLLPTMTQNISIPAGKTCQIQVMFKPKVAGYHHATIEIGSSVLPSQSEQVMAILIGSIGEILRGTSPALNDIKLYSGLGKITINLDGWAYNEKNLLTDLNQDRALDTFQIRFFDGDISNPLYNTQLTDPITVANTYEDQVPNVIRNFTTPIDPAQVSDEHISILTDFDYWFMKPYFMDKYGRDDDKYRKFPKNFEPYYRFTFDINNIRSLNRLRLSNVVSIDFKKPIKVFVENAFTGQFIELTPHINIYSTDLASPVRPKGTGFDLIIDDGGFIDQDGITNGRVRLNPIWVGIQGKTLKLGEGELEEPDLDKLVPEPPDNETKWGGLIVH